MQTNPTPEDQLTTREAAALLRRSVVTLERWRRLRTGPPYYNLMGRVRYDRADLSAWLEGQKRETMREAVAQ